MTYFLKFISTIAYVIDMPKEYVSLIDRAGVYHYILRKEWVQAYCHFTPIGSAFPDVLECLLLECENAEKRTTTASINHSPEVYWLLSGVTVLKNVGKK